MESPRHYRWIDLHVDLVRHRVSRGETELDVQGLSFQLLACLLRHSTDVVSFDTLMAEVWAPAVVNEETVTQRVKLLRQSLGDDGRSPRYIRSVRGRGYQLCEPAVALDALVPQETVTRESARRRWLWIVPVIVVGAAALAVGWHAHRTPTLAAPGPQQELLQRASYYAGIGQRDNNERAAALYQQLLAIDPTSVAAKVGLSRAYSARVCLYNFPYEWTRQAQDLAQAALRDAPNDATAWSALAYAHDCRGEMQPAIDAYEKAVALDPNDDASRSSAAYLYQERGQLADALRSNLAMRDPTARVRYRDVQIAREMDLLGFHDAAEGRFRKSFQLNPDNVFSNIAWPQHLYLQGRFAEAQAALDEAMARHTPHVGLYQLAGELALVRGDRAAALAAFRQAAALRPQMSMPTTLVALYQDQAPDPAWLEARITDMRKQLGQGMGYPSDQLELAMLQLAHGQRADALTTLSRAVDAGYSDQAYLQVSPLLKSLSAEPVYAQAIDGISRRVAAQRAQVLAAPWRPADLAAPSP